MDIIRNPEKEQWASITERPRIDVSHLHSTVREVLDDVKANGDNALKKYSERFDHVSLDSIAVSEEEKAEAKATVGKELLEAMATAHHNIKAFHEAQRFEGHPVETQPGVTCWQRSVAIERVGLYVPGGTAPLFSTVLMLATPAKIAGCREIVLCTPPGRDGRVNAAILVAAELAGVSKVYKVGGAQAIAALAYGTETVPKVDKIFGPGNQYVMAAKQLVAEGDVAIDMPAGPSEVCVIADGQANAAFVAADLLSQAEHGCDSQVMLITTSDAMLAEVAAEVERQLVALPRRDIAEKALANSKLVLVGSMEEALELSNAYAPEHLVLQTEECDRLATMVENAGSVFIGRYACESAGDYASGTNHTLPTHGYAKAYSGVNLDSFCRKITFQRLTAEGVRNIGPAVEIMARAESLEAHRNAMTLRLAEVCGEN